MKALAAVLGSEGDVGPFVVLGRRLAERGHGLVIAGFEEFRSRVRAEGMDYVVLPGNCEQLMRRLLGDTKGVMDAVRGVREMLGDPGIFTALEKAMSGVDIVMHTQFTEVTRLLAAAAEVPSVRVQVYPTEPCRSYSLVDPRRNDGTWRAVAMHRVSNLLMAWAMSPVMRGWRQRLGLPRRAGRGSPHTLYQFSPSLNPPDPAWGAHVHVTGEWLSQASRVEPASEQVEAFLGRGSPPLLVSFGSVSSSHLPPARAWVRELLAGRHIRAIVVDPEYPPGEAEGILTVDRVPFSTVLPRCRGVICHGSLGTTGAALRAGLPCLVVAFGGDQHFHAQAVCRNGAGPAYIDAQRGELTRSVLATRIEELVSGAYDQAASSWSSRLKADPGVDRAVGLLLELTEGGRSAPAVPARRRIRKPE